MSDDNMYADYTDEQIVNIAMALRGHSIEDDWYYHKAAFILGIDSTEGNWHKRIEQIKDFDLKFSRIKLCIWLLKELPKYFKYAS